MKIKKSDIMVNMVGMSKIYQTEMSNELYEIWFRVLEDLSLEEFQKAVKAYILDPKSVFFPKPGQIYALARPTLDQEQESALITERVFTALRSYGTDKTGCERAQLKIGSVGWAYVETQGGWPNFSRGISSDDQIPTLKAQARRVIQGLLSQKKSGMPLLPSEAAESNLKALGIDLKSMMPSMPEVRDADSETARRGATND